jgi:Zn-dependent oligopeptidase
MGKKKQQKLYQLNNKKDNPAKDQMKDILKELAEMKHKQEKINEKKETPLDLSHYKKKIKKEEKMEKYLRKKK